MNDNPAPTGPPEGDDQRTDETPAGASPPPRRLLRSSSDRVLAGVAGGLGRYFEVDPVIFRIGFILSIFFGGVGVLAYLLLAVFVPTDGDPDKAQSLGHRLRGAGFWRGLGLIIIVALLAIGLLVLAGGAAFAVALGWGVPTAIIIIAVGALLALAAFRGGARWLIPPAVALAVGASLAAASDLNFRGGIGDRDYQPPSAKAIPADGYRLGVGRLVVDLRDINWTGQRVVHLGVGLGAGQAEVVVPSRVCVVGSTHVGAGESEVAGERNQGLSVDQAAAPSTAKPRLDLDAHVDVGQLRVINSDTANTNHLAYRHGPFDQDLARQRAAEARACRAA
jgi:phage shock protein PspC (stress-responsive transcriptional regulator)